MNRRRSFFHHLSFFTLGLGMYCLAVPAAQAHPHGERKHKRGAKIMAQLDLSAEQTQEIDKIRQSFRSQKEALREDSQLAPEERRAQFDRLRKDKRAKIDQVLSDTQKSKRKELRKAHREKRRAKRIKKLTRKLSLTEAQSQQIAQIFASASQRAQAIRSKETLSLEERKSQLKAHRQQTDSEILAILNPEQSERYEKLKSKRRNRMKRRRARHVEL